MLLGRFMLPSLLLLLALACGSGGSSTPSPLPPEIASFTAQPSVIDPGQSANLSWITSHADRFMVEPDPGSVTGTSCQVRPAISTVYKLTATGAGGSTSATVQVRVQIQLSIAPTTAILLAGKSQSFNATVLGSANPSVSWSILEAEGGSITSSGLYTAPDRAGSFHVRATSQADSSVQAEALVTVEKPILSLTPLSLSLNQGARQTFQASVTGTANTAVQWNLLESPGGLLQASGSTASYTAPNTAGSFHVTAASQADPRQQATATITVPAVSMTLSPTAVTLKVGQNQAFSATVQGTVNNSVHWSVLEANGGSITSSGLYSTPDRAGNFRIRATSQADPSIVAEAQVTVEKPILSLTPLAVTLDQGASQSFQASVTGMANTAVQWSLLETGAGSLQPSGNTASYTAPAKAGLFHLQAASLADPSLSSTASIAVPSVSIDLSPATASLEVNKNLQLSATVKGSTNTLVRWEVEEAEGGSVSAQGLYTAPSKAGSYHVKATSLADPSQSARATLNVTAQELPGLSYALAGNTAFGPWSARVSAGPGHWLPGSTVRIAADLKIGSGHIAAIKAKGFAVEKLVLLATAERSFDADGWMRLPSDEKMSTLLTPTGLPIEGGVPGPVTDRFGTYPFKTPLDLMVELPLSALVTNGNESSVHFEASGALPANLPPGLYRLRLDFLLKDKYNYRDLNNYSASSRPFLPVRGSYGYSTLFPASGSHVSGRWVDATKIQARMPWILFGNYNSNGYYGLVAEEDSHRFALSGRNLIQDEVVLPMLDNSGNAITYSLDPSFPTESIDEGSNIPRDWTQGEIHLEIRGPKGYQLQQTIPLGQGVEKGLRKLGFLTWKAPAYGRYTAKITGWTSDTAGRTYEGGGSYSFWIAKRLTLATATFQGMPYPVGSKYGRDTAFNPPVPADVEMTATLYPASDPAQARTVSCSGKATTGGLFGVSQGMKQLPLDAPGEYEGSLLARYTDPDGHLWVCVMRHAGIVYDPASPIQARGKKLYVLQNGKYVYLDRGATGKEGYVEANGTSHLEHITFPYQSGDVLLMAAEGQGANKIEPVLLAENPASPIVWDGKLNDVGKSNLTIRTSNGYSPHLFPEYITDLQYFYAAAPRPGFMGRFIVGESITRAPYWPTTQTSFGGQIGASSNGDAAGDIYRLIGGIVMRDLGKTPVYAGYVASAFILPKGSNNNRIIAPGAEDLLGPTGEKAPFFLTGFRPGMALEQGSVWRPAVQIDPILPVDLRFSLFWPDGRSKSLNSTSDLSGSWAGSEAYTLDIPGIYRYTLVGTWNGKTGKMPGLPDSGGEFYVLPKTKPTGATGLTLDLASTTTFSAGGELLVSGKSSASKVRVALIMPGAVIFQGDVPVLSGRFEYRVKPEEVNRIAPIYDIRNTSTGAPQIGRVLHLSLMAEETAPDGSKFWDFKRLIIRGTTAVWAK